MPLPTIMTIPKKIGFSGGMVHPEEIPWLIRSRSIMSLPAMTIPKKIGIGVAWWHPEEMTWLSRSRRIRHRSHNNDNFEKMVYG